MTDSKPSSENTKFERGSSGVNSNLSGYPHPKDVISRPLPDVADHIDRKKWRRAKKEVKVNMLTSAISEIRTLRDLAYNSYKEEWESRDSSVRDIAFDVEGTKSAENQGNLDLKLNHLVVHGGRLAYLEFLERKLITGKSLDYPDNIIDVEYEVDDICKKLFRYRNAIADFDQSGAIHISTLDMPELSVEESGSGRLKDIISWEGIILASSGMLHSKDVSFQDGIAIIPREDWPFGVSTRNSIRNEWRDHKREWGDRTGELYFYRGKEYVCVGTPKIYVAPRSYYEKSVNTLSHKLEQAPDISMQPEEMPTSDIDFRETVLEFSKKEHKSKEKKDIEPGLFDSIKVPGKQCFDDLSFDEWLKYSDWFHSNIDRYNYLIWLDREYGPFQNNNYNRALIDASDHVKESVDSANDLILDYQGLSKGKDLVEQLSTGSVVEVIDKQGSKYFIKRILPDLSSRIYEVECAQSKKNIRILGAHAIARVVFLDIGSDQFKVLPNIQSKRDRHATPDESLSSVAKSSSLSQIFMEPRSVRRLGLETVSFAACDSDNTEVMAAIALSNFNESECLFIRGKKATISAIDNEAISLSVKGDETSIRYRVGTQKFFELLRDVSVEIVDLQDGVENDGLKISLTRDSAIAVDSRGHFYLHDALLSQKKISNADERPGISHSLQLQQSAQDQVIKEVVEASQSGKKKRTVLFRIDEKEGSLNGSVCGLTECDKGRHRWFLITRAGEFLSLSVAQTKQLCDRIHGGVKRELVFDSSHQTHHKSNETADIVGLTYD